MRVHLIKRQSIEDFARAHARARVSLAEWLTKIKFADWENTHDIKRTFGTVDFLGKSSGRVVFDIGGNQYRLICKVVFGKSRVHLFVCWIGTHAGYTQLCENQSQFTVNLF